MLHKLSLPFGEREVPTLERPTGFLKAERNLQRAVHCWILFPWAPSESCCSGHVCEHQALGRLERNIPRLDLSKEQSHLIIVIPNGDCWLTQTLRGRPPQQALRGQVASRGGQERMNLPPSALPLGPNSFIPRKYLLYGLPSSPPGLCSFPVLQPDPFRWCLARTSLPATRCCWQLTRMKALL